MMGQGSIRHNNREFTAANVDRERSEQNIVFVNEDLKRTYNNLFGEALETYNAGKKKTRDKIPDYYEHIRQSKQEKLFHEAIFQIGNLNDCGCGTEGGQRAAEALIEYAKSFQERNPHLHVFNMVLHMDEATPHLHVDYIPVATEQTRGLSTRVSMKQALKQQGFTGVGQKQTEWKAWMDREKEVLTEIAQQHEFEIISLGSNRRHMELPEYRAAIQESEAVQEQTAAALQELADMQEKKTELKGEIKSLSGTVAALKAAERVRVDFDTIQPEKTLTGAVKGVTVEQIQQLKEVAMTGAAAKQTVVALNKKNASLEKEKAEADKKAKEASHALFAGGGVSAHMPTVEVTADDLYNDKLDIMAVLVKASLCESRSDARRAVQQGGVSVDGEKVTDISTSYMLDEFAGEGKVVKRGKKKFAKVISK